MSQQTLHPAFEFLRSQQVASLNLQVEEYRHRNTGAQHIHIATNSPENVFMVALRTVPHDSTGVAHILEHTALCGSKKYPVRDPFFMMIRRSLNTFMNAMTSSDWTAYPFASQNRKDYDNLLNVYLDAVFFSRLDPLDFAQEGHRLAFSEPENPQSDLTYKGVVYNEMKGAMSSVSSTLWQTLTKYLYPSTTYHYNSGGDPETIPDLSYDQLKQFYKTHYHPSNAIFMTFGDIPAAELQAKFEQRALSQFKRLDTEISVPDEKRYLAPLRIDEAYAFDEEGSTEHKSHIVMGWLLGSSTNLLESMEASLLSSVLLDNSASPLLKTLETTSLGSSPSPLCGLDDSQKELCFVCGIEGSDANKSHELEFLVNQVLKDIVEKGIPEQQLTASLHQLELHQREITGDHYPYGLQLLMTALTSATHRGDPIALLDLDPVLEILRENIKDENYIKNLTKKLLLENNHRVTLTLHPDAALSARKVKAELEKLREIQDQLNDTEQQKIIDQSIALDKRQSQKDDASLLPKVGLEDIPKQMAYTPVTSKISKPIPLTSYNAGTNGLVYQQMIINLPSFTEEQIDLLPLYSSVLTELGVGDKSYLDTQLWQSRICGSINGMISVRGTPTDLSMLSGFMVLSAKGLSRNQGELSELMQQTLTQVRFDELERIRDLIAQIKARRMASITGSGHALAMTAAASGITPGAALSHRWGGLQGIRTIKQLDKTLDDGSNLENLGNNLQHIHQKILQAPRQYLAVGEEAKLADYTATLSKLFTVSPSGTHTPFAISTQAHKTETLWKTSTQVNFCAKAYATVPSTDPDAAPLNVLGGFLRNGYLHTAIREKGGAYGGGASQDNHTGAFRFYSYRDPRNQETLEDFDRSLAWLQQEKHSVQSVEEAILGVISAIDKPGSPAGEAKQTFHAELNGSSREIRETFRQQVLGVTIEDLQRVASKYLTPEAANTAVITNPDQAKTLEGLNLDIQSV